MPGPPPVAARLLPLSAAESAWLDELRQYWSGRPVNRMNIAAVSDYFDEFREAWFAPDSLREDPNPAINAIGAAIGDHLIRTTDMSWVIADYGDGMELAVHRAVGDIVVCPMNAVGKRWGEHTGLGFVADFVAYIEHAANTVPAK